MKAPNERITMVHRMKETLRLGSREVYLSTQAFADGTKTEDGYRSLSCFAYEYVPVWTYLVSGIRVERSCCMDYGKNTSAVLYTIENRSGETCTLTAEPFLKMAPKEQALEETKTFTYENGRITSGRYTLYIHTDAALAGQAESWQKLAYPVFRKGTFTLLCPEDEKNFAYTRDYENSHLLVVCNMSGEKLDFEVPEGYHGSRLLLSNYSDGEPGLRPYEGAMLYYED